MSGNGGGTHGVVRLHQKPLRSNIATGRDEPVTTRLFDRETVITELPAIVLAVHVEVGDLVSPGGHLVILESMKMEIPVVSEYHGRVRAIHVMPGQAVVVDQELLHLDVDDSCNCAHPPRHTFNRRDLRGIV